MRRLTWVEVSQIVRSGKLEQLKRTPEDQKLYEFHRTFVLKTFHNLETYMKFRIFGHPLRQRAQDNRLELDPDHVEKTQVTRFLPNEFPYAVERGIYHDVLWSNKPLQTKEIEDRVQNHMKALNRTEFIWFVNPPALQSIPGLFHAHVFSKSNSTVHTSEEAFKKRSSL